MHKRLFIWIIFSRFLVYILFFNVSEMIVDFIYKFQIDTTIKLLALILKSCIKSDSFKSFLFVECNWIGWYHLNSYSHSVASCDFRQFKTAGELTVTLKNIRLNHKCLYSENQMIYSKVSSSYTAYNTNERKFEIQNFNSKKVWILG